MSHERRHIAGALSERRSGVLLHLSSLEAPLGRGGRAFIDWLAQAGFSIWQFLPLGPTGADGSPYWVRSDSAGNPAFLDLDELPAADSDEFAAFVHAERDWLEDYACFEALSRAHNGIAWWNWPPEFRDREPHAMERVRRELPQELHRIRFEQFAFAWQWQRLRSYARSRGILLFGDLPFYVAPDSAETWANRGQFQLRDDGHPAAVAGVPPDYFSEKGQLWGNPLYDWDAMSRDGFAYWRARVHRQLARFDLLRIDHFRALAAHWSVPADAQDARAGEWRPTPGHELLRRLYDELHDLPIVAEDLGIITEDVEALRKSFRLPGMRVLQFGFDGSPKNPHLPHMHEPDSVVYTGTHDNDTTLGWYRSLDSETAKRVDYFLNVASGNMPEGLVRAALGSVGRLAILPAQDLLGLGSEARVNTPGTTTGNWSWRLPANSLTPELAGHYARLNYIYGRV